ncbi:MAG: amino acid adenylation domain-containing protein [Lachnospiraceae bacterium]|nr:amino acid adenylation domain-containing protein [Lachnospiraceae bacterium]
MMNSVLCYLEDTAKKFSDKVAVIDEQMEITFSQWKNMAQIVGYEIRQRRNGMQFPVLVYLPKSVMALVAFTGIMYSGNYYTPTDVKFPFKKVDSIIKCLLPELIITNEECGKKLIENGIKEDKLLYIDKLDFQREQLGSMFDKTETIDTDLAYVLFTSGSTGVPKGVAITHRGIIDYIDWAAKEFNITSNEKIANQAPFYFDNSILDIYLCMSQGTQLYIVPEMYFAFSAKLLTYLRDKQINFIFWVPSALIGVANSGLLERIDCSCLKKVLFCGEVMPNKHLNCWRKALPDVTYVNMYGPTEITDVCSYYIVDRLFKDEDSLPIGRACRNTRIMLLNEENQIIMDEGKIGELCVMGSCLSVGYYNNPEKTEEAFVQNPLHAHYSEKIYRTGDLAHYNQYGEIMFDGRKDFQIKHMGYRIELGEIETAILSIAEIENACCLYDSDKGAIVACCSVKHSIDEVYIKRILMNILPQYMIPAKYVLLNELPYNDNGKINRKMLSKSYIGE